LLSSHQVIKLQPKELEKDASVKAIFSIRGGTGSAQLLDMLDYEMIKKHPKVLMGYSDITALLIGGNLATLTAMLGSGYLPTDWNDKILFLEEVGACIDQVDRMMFQLKNAGILSKIQGFVFGAAQTASNEGCVDLEDMLASYFKTTNIPAFSGAMTAKCLFYP